MDDAFERRASKQSYVETERESGLEVGEEWATNDPWYGELLRIVKAVEEARKGNRRANSAGSDRSGTQIGCERLGQILGRSGLQRRFRTERYEGQASAGAAARLFQKVRTQL